LLRGQIWNDQRELPPYDDVLELSEPIPSKARLQ